MRATFLIALATLCLFGLLEPARAASFDCARAITPADRMICADPVLSSKDDRLGQAYRQRRDALTSDPDVLQALILENRRWLSTRMSCQTNYQCLNAWYDSRIAALSRDMAADAPQLPAAAPTQPTSPAPPPLPRRVACEVDDHTEMLTEDDCRKHQEAAEAVAKKNREAAEAKEQVERKAEEDRQAAERNAAKAKYQQIIAGHLAFEKDNSYDRINFDDFVLDGKTLASGQKRISIEGYYLKFGEAEFLLAADAAHLIPNPDSDRVIALLTDDAQRDIRKYFLECRHDPTAAQVGCHVVILGHVTMCERGSAPDKTTSPCVSVENGWNEVPPAD